MIASRVPIGSSASVAIRVTALRSRPLRIPNTYMHNRAVTSSAVNGCPNKVVKPRPGLFVISATVAVTISSTGSTSISSTTPTGGGGCPSPAFISRSACSGTAMNIRLEIHIP